MGFVVKVESRWTGQAGRAAGRLSSTVVHCAECQITCKEVRHSPCKATARDSELLQEACDETRFLAEVRAALLIVQDVRFDPAKDSARGPRGVFQQWADLVQSTITRCRLRVATREEVRAALERYRAFTDTGLDRIVG